MKFTGAWGDNNVGTPYAMTDTLFANTGRWYSIVYTFEKGKTRLYIDGKLADARTWAQCSFTPNPSDVFIGKNDNNQYPYWLNGAIDDIRIYNRALCDGEVKQLNRVKD